MSEDTNFAADTFFLEMEFAYIFVLEKILRHNIRSKRTAMRFFPIGVTSVNSFRIHAIVGKNVCFFIIATIYLNMFELYHSV